VSAWTHRRVVSLDDPAVVPFARLTEVELRRQWEPEHQVFMAEGHLVIERAVESGLPVQSVLTSPRWIDRLDEILGDWVGEVLVADEGLLREITGYRVHRGALAVVGRPREHSVAEIVSKPGPLLVLEDLVDATNVGLAIRSAAGLGVTSIVISPRCADPLYRRSVKSSMAAVLQTHWARSTDWSTDLAAVGRTREMVALTPLGDGLIDEVLLGRDPDRVALLLGSEGPGLTDEALRCATVRARIPMQGGVDSLNVAAATAVACFALDQARRLR